MANQVSPFISAQRTRDSGRVVGNTEVILGHMDVWSGFWTSATGPKICPGKCPLEWILSSPGLEARERTVASKEL
jgi:hypothetical protein